MSVVLASMISGSPVSISMTSAPSGVAVLVHQQVHGEELVEEMRARFQVLLVQRMQHGMAGAVGRGTGALRLRAAEVQALAAEGALVDAAVFQARERHAVMLELDHQLRRRAAHVFDRVLVAEIVAALDGVVHVPVPVVRRDVAERGVDAALRRHGVRARGEDLGHDRDMRLALRQLQRRAQPAAPGADDQAVETPARDIDHASRIRAAHRPSASRPRAVNSETLKRSHSGWR